MIGTIDLFGYGLVFVRRVDAEEQSVPDPGNECIPAATILDFYRKPDINL